MVRCFLIFVSLVTFSFPARAQEIFKNKIPVEAGVINLFNPRPLFFHTDTTGAEQNKNATFNAILKDMGIGLFPIIMEQSALVSSLATSSVETLVIGADITITGAVYIPSHKAIKINGRKFIKGEGGSIRFDGPCEAGREQIFQGFANGEVRGPFGGTALPEWWGLQNGRHDIAINAAIKAGAGLIDAGYLGHNVSLAARSYYIARPLDMSQTKCSLTGQGSGSTHLFATSAWANDETAAWETAEVLTPAGLWSENPDGLTGNHSAMIWMGSNRPVVVSYWSRVKGLALTAYDASAANPARYVSGISSRGWVEEQSSIEDVTVSFFSGFGVGFPRQKYRGEYGAAVINGMRATKLWITGGMKRNTVPIYTTQWCNNIHFGTVTVDCRLSKSASSAYAAPGGGDPAIYPPPGYIMDYPWVAVKAQGNSTFERFHIEGTCIGFWCSDSDIGNVIISGSAFLGMQDIANGAIYSGDGHSDPATGGEPGNEQPPANTNYYRYGCGILIAGQIEGSVGDYTGGTGPRDRVMVQGITSSACAYLLRDNAYGQHITSRGKGQFPLLSNASISLYARGNSYIRNAAYPWALAGVYDPDTPDTSRTFFVGPVY